SYPASIVVTAAGAVNPPQAISVELTVTGAGPVITTRQVLAHIADGDGWKTTIILVNADTTSSQTFSLKFWPGLATSPARLLSLDGVDQLVDSALTNRTIPPGGSLTIQTRGLDSGSLWQGWGELTSSSGINGAAIFRKQVSASQDSEGAVPI